MNNKRKYHHNAIVEERMFAMDIESLEREQYRRFIRFLKSKNITMNLVSRKKGHKDLSDNKLKLKDNGKSIN